MVLRPKGTVPGNSFLESLGNKFDGSSKFYVVFWHKCCKLYL